MGKECGYRLKEDLYNLSCVSKINVYFIILIYFYDFFNILKKIKLLLMFV